MRKSIILALCVLGVAQASIFPKSWGKRPRPTISNFVETGVSDYSGISDNIKIGTHVWKQMKEYFQATKSVGEFINALKHLDPTGALRKKFPDMGDVAKEMKNKVLKLITHEDLWGLLGDEASNKLYKLISILLKKYNQNIVKRDAGEDKNELSEEELEALGTIIDDMDEKGAPKSKIEKMNKILSQLEKGSGKLKDALENDSVKSVWKKICEKARAKNMVPPTGVPKEKKTIGYKMCSDKTYEKLQNILSKGNSVIKTVEKYFTPENVEKAKKIYNKVKGWFSKKPK